MNSRLGWRLPVGRPSSQRSELGVLAMPRASSTYSAERPVASYSAKSRYPAATRLIASLPGEAHGVMIAGLMRTLR